MQELLFDAFSDSVKIFIFVFAVNFIFSFFEDKISQKKLGKNYASVPLAAALGLGVTRVAAGVHFIGDVLAGYALAALCGIGLFIGRV